MPGVKLRIGILVVLLFAFVQPGCSLEAPPGENPDRADEVRVRGRLESSGVTSYMYGTHVIVDRARRQRYALRGEGLDLDAYVGQRVELTGSRVEGYPVDGGPPYLQVHTVRPLPSRGDSDE